MVFEQAKLLDQFPFDTQRNKVPMAAASSFIRGSEGYRSGKLKVATLASLAHLAFDP
jgi:hypothetical protein